VTRRLPLLPLAAAGALAAACAAGPRPAAVTPEEIPGLITQAQQHPQDAAPRFRLAVALAAAQQCDTATAVARAAQQLEPDNVLGPLVVGGCQEQVERYDEAVATYNDFAAQHPKARGVAALRARALLALRTAADTLRVAVDAPVTVPALLFAGDSLPDLLGASGGVFCQNPAAAGRFHISFNGASGEVNPRYSPDRQRVAFTYRPAGAPSFPPNVLGIARWAGDTEFVAVGDTSAYRPRWSPNGAHLAFECGDGFSSDQDVCVFLDANVPLASFVNAPRIFLTDSVLARPDGPSTFAWDPANPDRLAFARDILIGQWRSSAIYVANFDGTAIVRSRSTRSTSGRDSCRSASWIGRRAEM
jgi:hypothetical protein